MYNFGVLIFGIGRDTYGLAQLIVANVASIDTFDNTFLYQEKYRAFDHPQFMFDILRLYFIELYIFRYRCTFEL